MLIFAGMPSHRLARMNTKTTYLYQFGHVPPDKPNFPNYCAFHTAEVPYALHTLHTWNRPWKQLDKDLENIMSSYWVNFAKTGSPNGVICPNGRAMINRPGMLWRWTITLKSNPHS